MKIGNFIINSRIKNALTGARLGELLGVSQQQIYRYENGETEFSLKKLYLTQPNPTQFNSIQFNS
ncbi:helix-turn-helix transcriptional regulator, partial [Providencia rettgeri]